MANVSYFFEPQLDEFVANPSLIGDPAENQLDPRVVRMADGSVLLTWVGTSASTGMNFGTRQFNPLTGFSPGGTYNTLDGDQFNIRPTILNDGRLAIVGVNTDATDSAGGLSVVFRIGNFLSNATIIGNESDDQSQPDIATLTGGNIVVAYLDQFNGTDTDLCIAILDSQGAFVQTPLVIAGSTADELSPSVAALASGDFVVVWVAASSAIVGQRFNASGTPLDFSFFIDNVGFNEKPKVIGLADGGFAVVYQDDQHGAAGISLRIYDADGTARTGVLRADQSFAGTPGDSSEPTLIQLPNGFLVVAWTFTKQGSDADLYFRVFTADGVAVTDAAAFQNDAPGGPDQTQASLVSLNNMGQFFAAWTDFEVLDGGGSHIGARTFELTRTITDSSDGETLTGDALRDYIQSYGGDGHLFGKGGNDTLIGSNGNNLLDGGTGVDNMMGGGGNDTYIVDNAADTVVEFVGGGNDVVITSVSYTLGAEEEIEKLTTFGSASTTNLNLTGNGFAQTIVGNAGKNTLDGRGGGDRMQGMAGDDLYLVRHAGDVVIEAVGGGNDQVAAGISYALAAGQEIEVLSTFGSTSTADINLTGNAFAQTLIGNAGKNRLDGGGGGDRLQGLAGNDLYVIRNVGDLVIEAVGGGADEVITGITYALAAGQEIEKLATFGSASTGDINLTGNEFGQALTGNAGKNRLDGKGGADRMFGMAGDDLYIVDNAGDLVFETVGNGRDQVAAGVSYALQAGQEIEVLSTFGSASTGNINLTGNEFGQTIQGNAGNNVINGKGGHDILTGFAGQDTFVFDTALGPTNIDTITDYTVADDTIRLDDAIFTGLALGTLAASAFTIGAAATTANHRIIYNSTTGALLFDADGNGAGAAVRFATVSAGLAMTSADFVVV